MSQKTGKTLESTRPAPELLLASGTKKNGKVYCILPFRISCKSQITRFRCRDALPSYGTVTSSEH